MGGSIMGNAGRVLMIPKGDYNAATTYEMLDCVYYNGRSYVCKQTSTGNAPTNTTYWQVMTPDSSAEIQALTNEVRGNWATGGINVFDKSIMSDAVGEATNKNIVLKPNTTYTASTTLPKNNNNSANFFAYNSSGSPATSTNGLWDGQTRTITTNNDGVITIMYRTTDFTDTSAAWFLNHEFQIEEGSTATTYQPYAKTNVELTQALSASTVIDNVIDTTSASGVSGVSASLEKLTDINMGILFISFTTTADAGGSGLILGMLKSSCTPAHSTCRAVVPLVNDSGGDVEGSLYLNSTSVVRVYKVTSGHKYYATIPIILA